MLKTTLIRWATTAANEQLGGVPSVRDLLVRGWRASGPHPTRQTMWLMSVEVEDENKASNERLGDAAERREHAPQL